jgi:hypothetical protein
MNPRLHPGKLLIVTMALASGRPGGQHRRPGSPGRDPPGSSRRRCRPAGLPLHAAGPVPTFAPAPGGLPGTGTPALP